MAKTKKIPPQPTGEEFSEGEIVFVKLYDTFGRVRCADKRFRDSRTGRHLDVAVKDFSPRLHTRVNDLVLVDAIEDTFDDRTWVQLDAAHLGKVDDAFLNKYFALYINALNNRLNNVRKLMQKA
jgi:hypothetical protein